MYSYEYYILLEHVCIKYIVEVQLLERKTCIGPVAKIFLDLIIY